MRLSWTQFLQVSDKKDCLVVVGGFARNRRSRIIDTITSKY